jgi:hypothetical protein
VYAKFTKGVLEPIVTMERVLQIDLLPSLPVNNATEPPKRVNVAETEPRIPTVVAIIINKKTTMKTNYLFAIDAASNDILISESAKGSFKVTLIERIPSAEDELLFDAVALLTKISKQTEVDVPLFKAVEKVCQLIYGKRL